MARSVRQLLDAAREFHHQLSVFYTEVGEETEESRVKLLLDYMSRHEENLENSLEAYEEQAGQNVLERWMKFTPDAPGDDLLSDIEIHPEMSVDEVIDMAMEFDERLITFYRQISESTTVPAVRQLFSNLVEQEEAEEHMAARVAIEADSY